MRSLNRLMRLVLGLLIVANSIGCTKRVVVAPEEYSEVIDGEDFIHVTTTNGDVFQLQDAELTETGISGLLRHERGDVKPMGLGGKEKQSAYVEIRYDDVQSVEVERVNKKRILLIFGLVGASLVGAITLVEATGESGGGTPGGEPPGGKP